MTAGKLPMPGVRHRIGGEEGEAAAVAGPAAGIGWSVPPQQPQQVGNENGCATTSATAKGGEQQQGRCSASSNQAGLAPSIMQPLPLASRYVGAAKHDSLHPASLALGSSWIRRFLPATGDSTGAELGNEVTRLPKAVWGAGPGGQAGQAAGGGGRESGSHPAGPLLLASAPNEQHKEQHQEGGMAKARIGLGSFRETSGKVSENGVHIEKGKAPLEREKRESRQELTMARHDLGDNGVKESLRKVNTLPSHPGGAHGVEGRSRLQQYEGNHKPVLSTRGESQANGTIGARVTGFGSLRVLIKTPASDYGKIGGSGSPKLKGIEGEATAEADALAAAQADVNRLSNNAAVLLDRKPSGTSTMASQTGTKFTPLSKSKLLEDPCSGRPSRADEFASPWGFPRPTKKQDVEPDGGGSRPFMAQRDGGARETAAMVGGGGFKVSESAARVNPFGEGNFKFRSESGHHKFLDHESGVDRIKIGGSKFIGDKFVSSYPPANLGREEDGGQATENKFPTRAAEDASARLNTGAGFPTGFEDRKMKGVVGCGFSIGRHTETGPPQRPHSPEIPSHGLHQLPGDLCIGKVGHPLPYSPHSSFPGEDNSGEDTRNSRGKADPAKSPLTPLFGAAKAYEDGLDGRAAQSQQHAPWTSLFAAFKAKNHAVVANSSSSTSTLPPDVHSRLPDGSIPANRSFEGLKVNGAHDETRGGGCGRNDAPFPASPEARSRFDNQSSHFSSSPWPDEDGHIPNDDAGSGPYNPQATGSGFHSQVSRVANRSSGNSNGKYISTYRYDTGGEGEDTPARSRESSASEPDLRKYTGSQGEDEGQQMSNDANQAHVSSTPPKHFPEQAMSALKYDTSDSSPPSYPLGYNSSDSPVLPRGIVDEHLLSISGKLRNVEVDSEMEGIRVPRMQNRYRRDAVGFLPTRTKEMTSSKHENEAVYREHKDVGSFLSKDPDLQRTQPPVRDINREVNRHGRSNEGLESGLKHGKLRMSGEAMGEGGISGPSKRTRHHPNDLGSQMPSSWLKRWLPPSSGNAAKSPAGFARPTDYPRNGLTSEPPRSNGNTISMGFPDDRSAQARSAEAAKGKEIEIGNETEARNGLKVMSAKRGLRGLPPHPAPSAAAIALAGTGTRRIPFPQQRKRRVATWPPVRLQTAQAPDGGQRSSQS